MKKNVELIHSKAMGLVFVFTLFLFFASDLNPAYGATLISSSFDTNAEGFIYADDTFNGTSEPAYASGTYMATGGFSGGGLRVALGGQDNTTVTGMSGGWSRDFNLSAADTVTIVLRYRLLVSGAYEGDECGQALAAVDGVAMGPGSNDIVNEFCGADPQTNIDSDSGWVQVSFDVSLGAGTHTLTVGAYNNKKTRANETTQVLFDNIEVNAPDSGPGVILSNGFDIGVEGFTYTEDIFNGTSEPAYASGDYVVAGGFSGGGLRVTLGGQDNITVTGMSGGWSRDFNLSAANTVTIVLRYRLLVSGAYEGDECGQALVAIDGVAVGPGSSDILDEFCGADPQTNIDTDSSWVQVSFDVSLGAGTHTLTVGAYNNKKTRANETTQVFFDDIEVSGSGSDDNTPPVWDLTDGICSAQDDQSNGSVTVEFGRATDDMDGSNIRYNIYYAPSGSWDNANWSNNNKLLDVTPGAGSTCANAFTLSGLPDGVEYTFGARVADQSGNEELNTHTATATPTGGSGSAVILSAGFDTGIEGFVYTDGTFNETGEPTYSSGDYIPAGGFSGGGLRVILGGQDNTTVIGMSGGWSRDFDLSAADTVTIVLRYRLLVSGAYEGDECGQALVAVDGVAVGPGSSDILDEFCGADPQTNIDSDSDWVQVSFDVSLSAGTHTLTVGAYNNKKTRANEIMQVLFDDIAVSGQCQAPSVTLDTPKSYHIQPSSNISVMASACLDALTHAGWGVRFKLDGGINAGGVQIDDLQAPFQTTFSSVSQGEHTISTILLDDQGNEVSGPNTQDEVTQIAVGNIVVGYGDSITFGVGDDITADNTSMDGRNTGGGYTPVLDDLLTMATGIPHSIINEGVPGEKSSGGLERISDSLAANSMAQTYLLLFGSNDSFGSSPVPSGCGLNPGDTGYSGSFKDNMQQIINTILAAGKKPVLAKVPIALGPCSACTPYADPSSAERNLFIQDYNVVVGGGICHNSMPEQGLVTINAILETPPDFYSYFYLHQEEFSDNVHPNGAGYQSMADLWTSAILRE